VICSSASAHFVDDKARDGVFLRQCGKASRNGQYQQAFSLLALKLLDLVLHRLELVLDPTDLARFLFGAIAVFGRAGRLERLLVLLELTLEPLRFLTEAFQFLAPLLGVAALPALTLTLSSSPALARSASLALALCLALIRLPGALTGLTVPTLPGLSRCIQGPDTGDCDDAQNCGDFPHSGLQMALQC
jgi:hypothetical protein